MQRHGVRLRFRHYVHFESPGRPRRLDRAKLYALDLENAETLMFSASILERVEYRPQDGDHLTAMAFEDFGDNPWIGRLRVTWAQRAYWRTSTILELALGADLKAEDDDD